MRAVLYERNGMMMDTSKECEDKRRERDDTMPTDAELLSRIEAIALEGDDGCGKSTVLSLLSRRLRDDYGIDVMTVREPGGNRICESIRNLILSDDSEGMCSTTEAMLYAASRYQLLHDVVRPALGAGKVVAFDRFVYSSLVYQGIVGANVDGDEHALDTVIAINAIATKLWHPTIAFYLDLDPRVAAKRIGDNAEREVNRFDRRGLEYHDMVRAGYRKLCDMYSEFVMVDADRTPNEIVDDIIAKMIECGRNVDVADE